MKILIVDDEPLVRNSMARMVDNLNDKYTIEQAEDGEDAIILLKKQSFDLVITDIRMPAVDGLQLAAHIFEFYPETYIVMLTGYSDFDYARTAIQYKVMDYLLKPASVDDIKKSIIKIEKLIQERRTISEIGKLRNFNLLEKRVQDLFYELPVPYYDESLFPEFEYISLITFTINDDMLRKKTVRFSVKNIIGDICSEAGIPIVVVEESHITTVLFSNHKAESEINTLVKNITETIKKILKFDIKAFQGGSSKDLAEVSKLYQNSLHQLGITEKKAKESMVSSESVHRLIRSALSDIKKEYASDLTLTLIAERLFVNPNYLSSLFKSETGSTFTHHLTRIRMDNAKDLLKQTNLKIYQICSDVGYSDQAHFSRVFKSLEGMGPYEYREKEQNK
jgi:two-component system response regulator YesN